MKKFRWLMLILGLVLLSTTVLAEAPPQPKYAKAKVLQAETYDLGSLGGSNIKEISQQVILKVLGGEYKGKVITIEHMASGMMGGDMILKPGDKIMLLVDDQPSLAESPDGATLFFIADYARDVPIIWLISLFAIILVLIGGKKGLKALLSLLITIGLIFFVLFPLTLRGYDPLFVAILVAGLVSLIVFRIVGGKTVKSLAAAIGTLLGVTIAGLLAWIVGNMMHMSGMSSEESRILLYSMDMKIDFQGLLFASILIGALGAIMDVGMSIASAIDEVRKVHPEANLKNLFQAGMNVGRDVMGTMSNTLILAYTGSALPLLLLLIANNISLAKIINSEMIAVEILRALAGSIGLVLCIPITAIVSAFIYSKRS